MKDKIRKVISFLLMFALVFSTFQFSSITASYADDGDLTLAEQIILKADNKQLTVDYIGGKYMVQHIDSGTKNFTIKADKSYDNAAWSVKSVISSDDTMGDPKNVGNT